MEIIRCANGHFYDAEQCSSCPTCAKENGGVSPLPFETNMTAPLGGATGATAPVADYGSTVPLGGGVGAIMGTAAFGPGAGETVSIPQAPVSNGVQDYGSTEPVVPTGWVKKDEQQAAPAPAAAAAQQNVPFRPVVGWLVCSEGNVKGADYRIHGQYNFIGRAQHMDICITGDNTISAERAAVIAYDDREKMFSFGPGTGHNLVRVNGKMIMSPTILEPYDEVTIGETKLVFVPFCGERFDWNGR